MIKYEHAKPIESILDGDYRLTILKELRIFASRMREFDTSFIDSIEANLKNKGKISSKQFNSLVNIYISFNVEQNLNPKKQGKSHARY